MRAAAYLRVSTGQQTTDNQLPAVRDWVTAHGHELAEVYRENESAWRNGHQRELARLLSDLRSGQRKYDYLVVWSLDRLTRAGIGEIVTLVNNLKAYGCRVISIQESWTQQDGYVTELLYGIFGWIAKFESTRKSERVLAGLARARKEGRLVARTANHATGRDIWRDMRVSKQSPAKN
jgi:DNA invertase Pin-like site-specific DNA recombinase